MPSRERPPTPPEGSDPLQYALDQLRRLTRKVDGDGDYGIAGIEHRLTEVEDVRLVNIEEAIEKARQEREDMRHVQEVANARTEGRKDSLRVLWQAAGFLGATNVLGIIGVIVYFFSGGGQ